MCIKGNEQPKSIDWQVKKELGIDLDEVSYTKDPSYEVNAVSIKVINEEIGRYKEKDEISIEEYAKIIQKKDKKLNDLESRLLEIEYIYENADRNYRDLDMQYTEMVNYLREEVASLKEKVQEEENKRKELEESYKVELERKEEERLKKEEEYKDDLEVLEEMIEKELEAKVVWD